MSENPPLRIELWPQNNESIRTMAEHTSVQPTSLVNWLVAFALSRTREEFSQWLFDSPSTTAVPTPTTASPSDNS